MPLPGLGKLEAGVGSVHYTVDFTVPWFEVSPALHNPYYVVMFKAREAVRVTVYKEKMQNRNEINMGSKDCVCVQEKT